MFNQCVFVCGLTSEAELLIYQPTEGVGGWDDQFPLLSSCAIISETDHFWIESAWIADASDFVIMIVSLIILIIADAAGIIMDTDQRSAVGIAYARIPSDLSIIITPTERSGILVKSVSHSCVYVSVVTMVQLFIITRIIITHFCPTLRRFL